jgi:tetratricopeptide (TPR) repeat protein
MIRNEDFFDQIEDYCMEQLTEDLKVKFEEELTVNPELKKEVEFRMEIRDAVMEMDVLNFREKLKKVAVQSKANGNSSESFEMLNEFSDIQELKNVLTTEELINFYDSLPKVHAYHHEATSNENIHQFYRDQIEDESKLLDEDFDDLELDLELEGLEEAILEKDILNLRQTLQQVAKSVEPQFTVEEIDEYINGELTENELIDFESDLAENRSLREEVNLHKDVEVAVQEYDLMDLRNQLSSIIQSETSWNVSEQSIEDFIDGVLEGEELNEFVAELNDNTDLIAEVNLRKQINEAVGEKDIFELRDKLRTVKEVSEVKKVKMLVPESKSEVFRYVRSSVAVLILLLGIGGILRNGLTSGDHIYNNFYSSPSWTTERSVSSELTTWQNANYAYMRSDWNSVIDYLNKEKAPVNTSEYAVAEFYKAASLQNLNKFEEAISEYSKVIKQRDNMFVEEAEWYRSLCYLKLGQKEQAKQELLAVIDRKGHFENDAKAVLRKLRYSLK